MRLPFVIALAAATACGGEAPRSRPMEPALAEVHSPQVRRSMAALEQIAVDDLDDAARSPTARRDLARVAVDLGDVAARLPDLVSTLDLGEADRSHFVAFADALRGSAAELAVAARSAPGATVQAKIDQVGAACAACHVSYRVEPPG